MRFIVSLGNVRVNTSRGVNWGSLGGTRISPRCRELIAVSANCVEGRCSAGLRSLCRHVAARASSGMQLTLLIGDVVVTETMVEQCHLSLDARCLWQWLAHLGVGTLHGATREVVRISQDWVVDAQAVMTSSFFARLNVCLDGNVFDIVRGDHRSITLSWHSCAGEVSTSLVLRAKLVLSDIGGRCQVNGDMRREVSHLIFNVFRAQTG